MTLTYNGERGKQFLLSSTYSNLRAFTYIFKHLVYTRQDALAV